MLCRQSSAVEILDRLWQIPSCLLSQPWNPELLVHGFSHAACFGMQHYSRSLTCRDHFIHQLETFLQHWDVWLCPVMPGLAFEHKQTLKFLGSPVGGWLPVDEGLLPYWQWGITFTCIFNLMGNPVVTLPIRHLQKLDFTSSSTRASNSISEISISFTQVGLPIGVQVVGRRWQDMQLLAVADIIISQVS